MTKNTAEPIGKQTADLVGEKKAGVVNEVAKDLAKDAVKQEAQMSTGTEGETDPKASRFRGSDEIQQFAHLIEGGIGALEAAIDPEDGIPEDKIAGLLILERNGQNRTAFVRLLVNRLGITDIKTELPQAGGPDYTNDTTNLSDL